jgi:murein L,D-transpeptidase YafK
MKNPYYFLRLTRWDDSMKSIRLLTASVLALLGLSGCLATGPQAPAMGGSDDWTQAVAGEPVALAVFKGKREMVVVRDGVPQETLPVRLGRAPQGQKRRQGDLRTPEGVYRVCRVKPSRYKSFLWLDYPNLDDARQALKDGRLTKGQFERIAQSVEHGQCPPTDTPLGGLVGIHGDYEEPPRRYDWTEGCIAMVDNKDLVRLVQVVKPGTPVAIFP